MGKVTLRALCRLRSVDRRSQSTIGSLLCCLGSLPVLLGISAIGQDITFTNKTATFTNLQGEIYQHVLLVRGDQDGLIWTKGASGGRICYTNLHPDLLESFGISSNRIEIARVRAEQKAVADARYHALVLAEARAKPHVRPGWTNAAPVGSSSDGAAAFYNPNAAYGPGAAYGPVYGPDFLYGPGFLPYGPGVASVPSAASAPSARLAPSAPSAGLAGPGVASVPAASAPPVASAPSARPAPIARGPVAAPSPSGGKR